MKNFLYLLHLSTIFSSLVVITVSSQHGCGIRHKANLLQPRIFGGNDATYGHAPWMVSLYENKMMRCGATIISDVWVITAAHCVELRKMNKNLKFTYKLVAGDYNVNEVDEYEQEREAIRIVDGINYDGRTLQNDIALIEVDEPFLFNSHIQPACLPDLDETPYPFTKCQVAGWGYDSSRLRPEILQILTVYAYPHKICEVIHRPSKNSMSAVTHQMMCAGELKSEKGVCKGDSGGPLMCSRNGNEQVITGIVSWGKGCGDPEYLPVFTRVESYLSWIKPIIKTRTINKNPCRYQGVKFDDKVSGIVQSPGYKNGSYSSNMDCSWKFDMTAFKPKQILIRIMDFELSAPFNGKCRTSYLSIFTGQKYDQLYETFCGVQSNREIILPNTNNVKFQFKSNYGVSKKGFYLKINTS